MPQFGDSFARKIIDMSLFISPPIDLYSSGQYHGKYATYSHYNYLRPGLIAKLKRHRFEVALSFARDRFGTRAIDFGCADGIFLPSLSAYFSEVVGIDAEPNFYRIAESLASNLKLQNVQTIFNRDLTLADLSNRLNGKYDVLFLLEVLEHVGNSPATMYTDKIALIRDLFTLLNPGAAIIASVPRMTGPLFVAKYIVQKLTRMDAEYHSPSELILSGLGDTSRVQTRWKNGHIGFNERLLTNSLKSNFSIKQRSTLTSVFYKITQRA